jgi:hypothetical protein
MVLYSLFVLRTNSTFLSICWPVSINIPTSHIFQHNLRLLTKTFQKVGVSYPSPHPSSSVRPCVCHSFLKEYRPYSKSSLTLTLDEWRFNLSLSRVSLLFLNSCRASVVPYYATAHPPAIGRILWPIIVHFRCPHSGSTFSLHESIDFDTLSTNSLVVTRTDPQFFCILRSNINIFY